MTSLDMVKSPLAGIIREKEIFDAMFTDSPVGVCLMDVTGKFLDVNEACAGLFGYSRSEMIGMTFQEITHPADIVYDTEMMNKVVRGEIQHYEMVKRYIDKLGRLVWAEVHMRAVISNGTPEYFIKHIEPQRGKNGKCVPDIRIGDLFKNRTTKCFLWAVVSTLFFNTIISIIGLLHALGFVAAH